jgi:hypothetical protein
MFSDSAVDLYSKGIRFSYWLWVLKVVSSSICPGERLQIGHDILLPKLLNSVQFVMPETVSRDRYWRQTDSHRHSDARFQSSQVQLHVNAGNYMYHLL